MPSKGQTISEETRARMSAAQKGHAVSSATRAKLSAVQKGRKAPWAEGPRSPEHQAALTAALNSPEVRARISANRRGKGGLRGEANPNWRGEEVDYFALHSWVRREKGAAAAQTCAHCGRPALDWANISHEYHRDLDDFMALCRKCHKRYDRKGARAYGD